MSLDEKFIRVNINDWWGILGFELLNKSNGEKYTESDFVCNYAGES